MDALRKEQLDQLPASAGIEDVIPVLIVPLAEQVRDADGGCHSIAELVTASVGVLERA